MQSAEDFMRQFFEEHLSFEKEEQARRLLFHQRFYANDCHWGKDLGKVWRARSLSVLSVSGTAMEAEVIALRLANNEPELYCQIRFRLNNAGQGWLITGVDLPCCCRGNGQSNNKDCPSCHGTGWRDTNPALVQISTNVSGVVQMQTGGRAVPG